MAIANITTNYVGRERDISILQNPDASVADTQVVKVGFGSMGRYCAGVQKLIQRYTILLFTNLGSQPTFPAVGTELYYKLKQGYVQPDLLEVRQIFSTASYSVVNTLKAYQTSTSKDLPADERIASAELVDVQVSGDTVKFRVQITTDAGDSVDFLVPLPK